MPTADQRAADDLNPFSRRRTQVMTLAYIEAFVAQAIEMGYPSIALAQLLQDTLICRHKDIIGEWIPVSEPGLSDVVVAKQKWMLGLRLEEIDGTVLSIACRNHCAAVAHSPRPRPARSRGGTSRSVLLNCGHGARSRPEPMANGMTNA